MTEDGELLRRYVEAQSDAAFAELVQRHLDLVHSTALRCLNGDAQLAEDVAQLVFAELAHKAHRLSVRAALSGWLYTTAYFIAAKAVRTEHRRRTREQEAQTLSELCREPEPGVDWTKLSLLLDQSMHELSESDREVVVLRFFENQSHAVIAAKLGLSENTARMRVTRSLEKLRSCLVRRGFATSAGALSSAISANAVQTAPAGLAAAVITASTAGSASAAGVTFNLIKLVSLTKPQLAVASLLLTGATATILLQHQAQARWRAENDALRQQIVQLQGERDSLANGVPRLKRALVPRLPAPAVQVSAATDPGLDQLSATNPYARFLEKPPRLALVQVQSYLEANGRNAASLLAAYRTTGDPALLREAMQRYPDDPIVAFEAAFKKDASPEEHRQWLDAFKKAAPDNALANYLSALDFFKTGHPDQSVQDFADASTKTFQDYSAERYQADAEAYLGAGYSVADAKVVAGMQLLLPQLAQVKQAGLSMIELSKSYQQAGDAASAQAALDMVIGLGQHYSSQTPGEPLISQLVGISLESLAFNAMDPNAAYGDSGQTVQDRLDQLKQQRARVTELSSQAEALFPKVSALDWVSYRDRWLMFGEDNAAHWLINKYAAK